MSKTEVREHCLDYLERHSRESDAVLAVGLAHSLLKVYGGRRRCVRDSKGNRVLRNVESGLKETTDFFFGG